MRDRLLSCAVMAALVACQRPAPATPPRQTEDFMRLLEDSAAHPAADPFEVCAGGGYTSFVVQVLDSVTRRPAAWGARLTWRVGRTIDGAGPMPKYPMKLEDIEALSGPFGRPGTFDILVTKPGYRDWYRAGVVVPGTTDPQGPSRCTITQPVYLRALLQHADRIRASAPALARPRSV